MAKKKVNLVAAIISLPRNIIKFIGEARDELKKVSWPSREETIRYTIIVIVFSLVLGGVIGVIDYLFQLLLESLV